MFTHRCVTGAAVAIDRDVVTMPAHPGGGIS
jgi:hypothetical protein